MLILIMRERVGFGEVRFDEGLIIIWRNGLGHTGKVRKGRVWLGEDGLGQGRLGLGRVWLWEDGLCDCLIMKERIELGEIRLG